jgi:dTDP-4-dehydrorhamnose reductase
VGCALGYISAGLVFDGTKPYPQQYYEFDTPNPSSIYARSKLAGELLAQTLLRRFYIIRTSWVFGPRPTSGKLNFVESVLQQARANKPVSLVTDRSMNPTYLPDLTAAVLQLVETGAYGIYHLVNEGVVSPLDFGHAIFQRLGTNPQINALKQSDFPAKAPPVYNVGLKNFAAAENLNIRLRPWQDALVDYLHLIA